MFSIRKRLGCPSSFHMREHTQRRPVREMAHHSAFLCSKKIILTLGKKKKKKRGFQNRRVSKLEKMSKTVFIFRSRVDWTLRQVE